MNTRGVIGFMMALAGLLLPAKVEASGERSQINLAGAWRFALDRADAGMLEDWEKRTLPGTIELPGILQAQGYGDEISTNTPWILSLYDRSWFLRADYLPYTKPGAVKVPFLCQPPRHYVGAAWYQKDFEIPTAWKDRRVGLILERPHWETTVWLDDRKVGSCNSLVAAHDYDLGVVPPGRHQFTIRVDNSLLMAYRPDAHSVSDSVGGSWNGIVGKIELDATSPVWIEDAQVFPNIAKKSARIKVTIGNDTHIAGDGTLSVPGATTPARWDTNGGTVEIEVALGEKAELWDEFNPALQHLTLRLTGTQAADERELVFGLRDLKAQRAKFLLNGNEIYFRGTHNGGDFPLTGSPPMDVEAWRKMFRTCEAWGLNLMRFHSWCPPEAAFTAADELGFYLQPECGLWNEISPGSAMEAMLQLETARMMKAYGNHPCYLLLSPSNEPKGRWKDALPKWVERWRAEDARRLYTTGTGWSLIDAPGPVKGADYLAIGRIGSHLVRGNSGWFGKDYSASLHGVDVPVISHELGQWCAYPDFAIIKKFTGYAQPGNYEIFRDSLAAHGLLERDKDFAWASGKFQLACYKEEIEANLRTPGLSGFQLLDLHDYTGQGTALVGLLDTFWESKGYATPDKFRQFCGATVPLARLKTRVFTTADAFDPDVEIANFGKESIVNAEPAWQVVNAKGATVASGQWTTQTIPRGKNIQVEKISLDLNKLRAPEAYKLVVSLKGTKARNDWNFWVYPSMAARDEPTNEVLLTRSWEEAQVKLAAGGKVLYLPRPADLDWTSPPLAGLPIFWNRLMGPGWSRMLGLWCDAKHPALAEFPTEDFGDWQWIDLVRNARAMNLDTLPRELQPIVQPVDDWNRNYKLGLLFECAIGPGRLLVCSADLAGQLESRPVARQLRSSLLDYMAGEKFMPNVKVSPTELGGMFFDTHIMRKLGATAMASGQSAENLIDGDPNTFWQAGGARGGGRHPYDLMISFPQPTAMSGVVLMARQNDRNHEGDIRGYTIQASEDGAAWRELKHGELSSTFDPQRVIFTETITTKFLKFTALSGFGGDRTVALAELAVIYAGPKLADASDGAVEYKLIRTASPEIDEGTEAGPAERRPKRKQ